MHANEWKAYFAGHTYSGDAVHRYFCGRYHLDTSFLITPLIDLSGYTTVFLQFDTKTSKIVLGAQFSVEIVHAPVNPDSFGVTVLAESPVFGSDDSSRWVTHVVD